MSTTSGLYLHSITKGVRTITYTGTIKIDQATLDRIEADRKWLAENVPLPANSVKIPSNPATSVVSLFGFLHFLG